jgi:hypothetical protein
VSPALALNNDAFGVKIRSQLAVKEPTAKWPLLLHSKLRLHLTVTFPLFSSDLVVGTF